MKESQVKICKKNKYYFLVGFTLIEIMAVISIIMFVASLLMPTLTRARSQARFARWLGYNAVLSRDATCAVNYNFQEGSGESIKTSTAACKSDDRYNNALYAGVVNNDCEWSPGRWDLEKNALQFNGCDTYVEVPVNKALSLVNDDCVSIMMWVKFDNISEPQVLFSKSKPTGSASVSSSSYSGSVEINHPGEDVNVSEVNESSSNIQYELAYLGNGRFHIDVQGSCFDVTLPDIKNNKWYSFALVFDTTPWSDDSLDSTTTGKCGRYRHRTHHRLGELAGSCTNTETTAGDSNGSGGSGGASSGATSSTTFAVGAARLYVNGTLRAQADILTKDTLPTSDTNLLIGCRWNNDRPDQVLVGKVDEFVLFKRPLSDGEIAGFHDMGRN